MLSGAMFTSEQNSYMYAEISSDDDDDNDNKNRNARFRNLIYRANDSLVERL